MLGRELREALSEVMRRHAFGAAALMPKAPKTVPASEAAPSRSDRPDTAPVTAAARPEAAPEPEAAAEPDASTQDPGDSGAGVLERRKSPRKPFARQVLATGGGSSHALIGSDLSVGGMRVRPDPTLAVGAEVKLAIYGSAGIPPVLIKAEVTRDDGDDGLVIQFRKVSPAAAVALERLVESLPGARGASGPDVVVSEVLERS
jgi:hypothetical protein